MRTQSTSSAARLATDGIHRDDWSADVMYTATPPPPRRAALSAVAPEYRVPVATDDVVSVLGLNVSLCNNCQGYSDQQLDGRLHQA